MQENSAVTYTSNAFKCMSNIGKERYRESVHCLLGYIKRIIEQEGISEYKFCKDNNLSCSYVHNLRRILSDSPTAFSVRISFDLIYYLTIKYKIPYSSLDYLDISGNYPDNYPPATPPTKQAKKATKGTKKAKPAPPKPTFL